MFYNGYAREGRSAERFLYLVSLIEGLFIIIIALLDLCGYLMPPKSFRFTWTIVPYIRLVSARLR